MQFGHKIGQKGLILVAVPSLFEILFVFILSGLLNQAEKEAAVEAQSKAVIACANALTRATIDTTTAAGAYKITGNQLFSQRAELALESAKVQSDKLRVLLKNKPKRLKDLESVKSLIQQLVKVVEILKEPAEDGATPTLTSLVGRGRQFTAINRLVNHLGVTTNMLIADELKIELESPMQKARTREKIKLVLFSGTVLNIAIAFGLAAYFSRSVTHRLLIVRENTERLASRQKLVAPIGGKDEIADLDAAFHAAASRLEELEGFKQQLIGVVSHELKTPLSSMQVNLALMSSGATGELPEKAQKKIDVIESNITRLMRLINDLLDIEKMQAGKFELQLKSHQLKRIIESSLESVRAYAESRKIEILIPPDSEAQPEVYVDFDRTVQVLVNLLSNALKYSESNSRIEIEVIEQTTNSADPNDFTNSGSPPDSPNGEDYCVLSVIDKGRGIPREHLDRIFDRFQQVEISDATEKKGSGLGLAICKAIIDEHGGKIGVSSEPGAGSRFWFSMKKSRANHS